MTSISTKMINIKLIKDMNNKSRVIDRLWNTFNRFRIPFNKVKDDKKMHNTIKNAISAAPSIIGKHIRIFFA